jgi:predicted dehydrogenase
MAARVRIGVVGLGYWGPNLVRNLADLDSFEIAYVCDQRPAALEPIERRYTTVSSTTQFHELLADGDVDAVAIATPVSTHYALAKAALEAGKHAFVEKPLAASSDEVRELMELAEERDRVLMPGHTFLYSPAVRTIKNLIDEGELGDIYFVSSSRVNLGLHQPDVSVVWDLGPHDFSILLFWLEELPSRVQAVGRDSIVRGIPDVAFVDLTFPSGVVAHAELSWLAPSKLRRTVVVGSEKMVVYDDGSAEPVRIFDHGVVYQDPESFGQYQLSYRTGDIVSPRLDTAEPLALELDDFFSRIRLGHPPPGTLELARDVVRLVERTEAAVATGGRLAFA